MGRSTLIIFLKTRFFEIFFLLNFRFLDCMVKSSGYVCIHTYTIHTSTYTYIHIRVYTYIFVYIEREGMNVSYLDTEIELVREELYGELGYLGLESHSRCLLSLLQPLLESSRTHHRDLESEKKQSPPLDKPPIKTARLKIVLLK